MASVPSSSVRCPREGAVDGATETAVRLPRGKAGGTSRTAFQSPRKGLVESPSGARGTPRLGREWEGQAPPGEPPGASWRYALGSPEEDSRCLKRRRRGPSRN